MNLPNRFTPVLIGTAVMTIISVFPLLNMINLLCCAGVIAGGFAGVYSYKKQIQDTGFPLTHKDGGMIGILSGILAAVLVSGFGLIISLFSDANPILEVMKAFDEMNIQTPPELAQYVEKFSNEYNEYGFSPSVTIISFASNLVLYPLFGAIGALLAVTLFNKKNTPQV